MGLDDICKKTEINKDLNFIYPATVSGFDKIVTNCISLKIGYKVSISSPLQLIAAIARVQLQLLLLSEV